MSDRTCSIKDCKNKHYGNGYCNRHWQLWKRNGTPERILHFRDICEIKGRGNKHVARGFCDKHYRRWKKHGDPYATEMYYDPEEAFAAYSEWQGDCLIWTRNTNFDGYGFMKAHGVNIGAHRYAWERVNGPIPHGMRIDHTCFNPPCVNISHLRLATASQNGSHLSGGRPGSASGVRNVHKHNNGWSVSVTKDRERHHFGLYQDINEAAKVAEQARRELFGEFAGRGQQ